MRLCNRVLGSALKEDYQVYSLKYTVGTIHAAADVFGWGEFC